MAFRAQDGQTPDAFDGLIARGPGNATLEQLASLIDWKPLRMIFAPAYDASGRGQLGLDPVILYKMLLLEELYALSDVEVSREAGDRLSFRRFLGLDPSQQAPDDTTLVKFRARLRERGLLEKARLEVERQLAQKNLCVRPGAIKVVDATVIPAATRPPKDKPKPEGGEGTNEAPQAPTADAPTQPTPEPAPAPARKESERGLDHEAAFGGKKGKLRYGYKMHAAMDAQTGIVTAFAVTPANVSDTKVFGVLLEKEEAGVLADKGYDSRENREELAGRGALDGIMRRVGGRREMTVLGQLETWRNKALSKMRAPSEGVFAAMKRWGRLGRAVYKGIVRVRDQVVMAVTAHNALKALRLHRARCA